MMKTIPTVLLLAAAIFAAACGGQKAETTEKQKMETIETRSEGRSSER